MFDAFYQNFNFKSLFFAIFLSQENFKKKGFLNKEAEVYQHSGSGGRKEMFYHPFCQNFSPIPYYFPHNFYKNFLMGR